MSTERGLPIAATKVIATGSAGKDFLRATVMLTPPTNNSSAADDAKLLSQWPSTVIQWLRSKEQNFYLRVRAEPVRYAGTDGRCVNLLSATRH
jgi:hypothetical protein